MTSERWFIIGTAIFLLVGLPGLPAFAVGVIQLPQTGQATCYTPAILSVTSAADTVAVDGHCTLREAIDAVNGGAVVNECTSVFGNFGSNDAIGFAIDGAADSGWACGVSPACLLSNPVQPYYQQWGCYRGVSYCPVVSGPVVPFMGQKT